MNSQQRIMIFRFIDKRYEENLIEDKVWKKSRISFNPCLQLRKEVRDDNWIRNQVFPSFLGERTLTNQESGKKKKTTQVKSRKKSATNNGMNDWNEKECLCSEDNIRVRAVTALLKTFITCRRNNVFSKELHVLSPSSTLFSHWFLFPVIIILSYSIGSESFTSSVLLDPPAPGILFSHHSLRKRSLLSLFQECNSFSLDCYFSRGLKVISHTWVHQRQQSQTHFM
jgi:hypothetical protein